MIDAGFESAPAASDARERVEAAEAGVWPPRIAFGVVILLLLACLFGGGSPRPRVWSLLYLRPLIVVGLAALLLLPGRPDWRAVCAPLLLLGAFAATMAVQLIPLPPSVWAGLPGRRHYLEAAQAAGIPETWRAISLTPDATWNALAALLVPLAVLIGCARLRTDQRAALLPVVIGMIGASAALGVVQMTVHLQLYRVVHLGFPIGFLANKNHAAAFLALAIPLVRVWMVRPTRDRDSGLLRTGVGVGVMLFMVPMILAAGSRAGLVLGALGTAAALLIAPPGGREGKTSRWQRVGRIAVWVAPVLLIGITIWVGRDVSVERFATLSEYEAEGRVQSLPQLIQMARDFFPVGTGAGAFDPVYRGYEPDALLARTYLNHAHNDLIELAITGGLPVLLVIAGFLLWAARKAVLAFAKRRGNGEEQLLARGGATVIALLFLASLVDYPLRAPLLSAVFAVACVWLAGAGEESARRRGGSRSGRERRR